MLGELALLKKRALRRGIWFKVLSRVERSICDITMRAVDSIRSQKLLSAIKVILDKLRKALESPVSALTRTVGRQLVLMLTKVALSWGHSEARDWPSDEHFARYLVVCWHMNVPEYYRLSMARGQLPLSRLLP